MPCLKGMAAGFLAAEMRCPCGQLVPAARTSQLAEGRRSRRCVTVSAQDNGFSSDQSSKALQYQLSRSSTPKSPAAASPAHDHTSTIYEQELTKRKNQAREFITPWLVRAIELCVSLFNCGFLAFMLCCRFLFSSTNPGRPPLVPPITLGAACPFSHMPESTHFLLQTSKAKLRSMDTLAALRDQTPGLSSEQQDTALKRLLGQSWQASS